jgi:hypothetical protein
MILTRKGDILTDSEIADLTGVDCRRVNQLRRGSDRDQGPHTSRFPCTKSPDGLQVGLEGPLTSLRLASGSTRTSIWGSWRALSFPGSSQWQETFLGCGRKTWPPAMSPTGPSSGSRTTATTWSRRTAGLPAVLILLLWTILCAATWRYILWGLRICVELGLHDV